MLTHLSPPHNRKAKQLVCISKHQTNTDKKKTSMSLLLPLLLPFSALFMRNQATKITLVIYFIMLIFSTSSRRHIHEAIEGQRQQQISSDSQSIISRSTDGSRSRDTNTDDQIYAASQRSTPAGPNPLHN
ncbi:hypothetical protein Dimus_008728 [Dionaea muscipula]